LLPGETRREARGEEGQASKKEREKTGGKSERPAEGDVRGFTGLNG